MFEKTIATMRQVNLEMERSNDMTADWLRSIQEPHERSERLLCVTAWQRLSASQLFRILRGAMLIEHFKGPQPSLRNTYEQQVEEMGY